MPLKHQFIFLHDHLNAREISENYLSESSAHGQFFALLELPRQRSDQRPLLDEIISQALDIFTTSQEANPEMLLEEILQKINQLLPTLATNSKIKNWLNTLDLVLGIIDQEAVYLSQVGNINGLLIHQQQTTSILEKTTIVNPHKIFNDITSGQLEAGDVLVISTNSLFDYISQEKIKQISKQYTPEGAALKISQLLETVPNFVTFNALLVKNGSLTDREVKLEEIKPKEKDGSEGIITATTTKITDYQSRAPATPLPPVKTKLVLDLKALNNLKTFRTLKKLLGWLIYFFQIIKKIFIWLASQIKKGLLFLTSSQYRQTQETEALDKLQTLTDKKYYWWQTLNKRKKITILALFIIILIFLQSLVFLTQKRATENKDKNYRETLATINSQWQAMEAKLIYQDEEGAENIVLAIEKTLQEVKANSPEQQKAIDNLKERVFHELNKIRHIHEVAVPAEISDLSQTITSAQRIVQKDGVFYILGSDKLYQLKDNQLTPLLDFGQGQFLNDWPGKQKLILGNSEQYFIFDLATKKIEAFPFTKTAGNQAVQDLLIYGNNLYVLDAIDKQIFKYPEKGSAFANGVPWLKEDIDLSQASSFTVDGSVYVISNNGQIFNFLKGSLVKFEYRQPRPTLGQKTVIKTFKDSNYLYIIDPNNKRIVILDKEGNIKDQYTSQKFDDLKDLAIDPQEKAIYLLNGNHLYLLAINQ
jgi:hypothetical protein